MARYDITMQSGLSFNRFYRRNREAFCVLMPAGF